MFRYRLHLEDDSDAGEATYAQMINPGEEILVGNGRRFRVAGVVPFEEEDESRFVGCCRSRPRSSPWASRVPATEIASSLARPGDGDHVLVELDPDAIRYAEGSPRGLLGVGAEEDHDARAARDDRAVEVRAATY